MFGLVGWYYWFYFKKMFISLTCGTPIEPLSTHYMSFPRSCSGSCNFLLHVFFLKKGLIRFRIHFNVQYILSLWFSYWNQCIFIENTLVTLPSYGLHLDCSLLLNEHHNCFIPWTWSDFMSLQNVKCSSPSNQI